MSYTEYASQKSGNVKNNGNIQAGKQINPNSNRFTCNNQITGNNYIQAIDTYKKLYTIYSTKPGSYCVKDYSGNFTPLQDCIGTGECPYNATSANNAFYINTVCNNNNNNNNNNNDILSVQDLGVYLDDCGANIRDYNNSNSLKTYDSAEELAKKLDVSYNSLLQTRSDLDNKMNELLGNNPNSILYENQNQLDAGVYTTILWTVLVTSSLYYIFTKI